MSLWVSRFPFVCILTKAELADTVREGERGAGDNTVLDITQAEVNLEVVFPVVQAFLRRD